MLYDLAANRINAMDPIRRRSEAQIKAEAEPIFEIVLLFQNNLSVIDVEAVVAKVEVAPSVEIVVGMIEVVSIVTVYQATQFDAAEEIVDAGVLFSFFLDGRNLFLDFGHVIGFFDGRRGRLRGGHVGRLRRFHLRQPRFELADSLFKRFYYFGHFGRIRLRLGFTLSLVLRGSLLAYFLIGRGGVQSNLVGPVGPGG